jgi:hypothetical protein
MTRISNRILIGSFMILFIISSTILLIASTARTPVPAWGGYLDVAIVVLIALAWRSYFFLSILPHAIRLWTLELSQ